MTLRIATKFFATENEAVWNFMEDQYKIRIS